MSSVLKWSKLLSISLDLHYYSMHNMCFCLTTLPNSHKSLNWLSILEWILGRIVCKTNRKAVCSFSSMTSLAWFTVRAKSILMSEFRHLPYLQGCLEGAFTRAGVFNSSLNGRVQEMWLSTRESSHGRGSNCKVIVLQPWWGLRLPGHCSFEMDLGM